MTTLSNSLRRLGAVCAWTIFTAFPLLSFSLFLVFPPNVATAVAICATFVFVAVSAPLLGHVTPPRVRFNAIFLTLIAAEIVSTAIFIDSPATLGSAAFLIVGQVLVYAASAPLRALFWSDFGDFTRSAVPALIALLALGTTLSIAMSALSADFADPFDGQGRFRILALSSYGHSIAAEAAAALGLMLLLRKSAVSGTTTVIVSGCVALLVLSGTRLGLCYVAILLIGVVLHLRIIGPTVFLFLCLSMLGLVAALLFTPLGFVLADLLDLLQAAFPDLRVLGSSADATSGRAVLNEALAAVFVENPLIGVGFDHPALQYGAQYVLGEDAQFAGALSESGLRVAAAKGLLVLVPTLIFYGVGLTRLDRPGGAFLVALSTVSLMRFILNGGLERMVTPVDVWLFVFAAIAVSAPREALRSGAAVGLSGGSYMSFPRVLFVAAETYSRVGGLQQFNRRVVSNLVALAAEAGVQGPQVFVLRDAPETLPEMGGGAIRSFASRWALLRHVAMSASSFDLVLIGHINLLPVSMIAKIANRGARTVLFVHGGEVWNDPAIRARRFYEPWLAKSLDRIVSVSSFTARRMADEFNVSADRFSVLPNAVDPVPPAHVTKRERLVLTVSRLAAHDWGKNVDAVVRAFAELGPRVPAARLEIVGDGALRPGLESLAAALGVVDRVVFRGRVSDADLQGAYRRARVFAMPSAKEGFGIVFLEAWLHGLPVICGTEDAAHEIVSDGQDGFAVDPANTAKLAAALERLLADDQLAEAMGRAGNRKVLQHYLNENFRSNLRGIVADVAGLPRGDEAARAQGRSVA